MKPVEGIDPKRTAACVVSELGTMDYAQAYALQLRLNKQRARGEIDDQLLLLEHPHVFTLGRRGRTENVLSTDEQIVAAGATVYQSDRGGDVTYHGPGQLVAYPILYLPEGQRDVPRYVRLLEETVIRLLAELGVRAGREPAFPGVWVGEEKICAVGVKISEWVTMHGLALNVTTDMAYFGHIVPCGIVGKGVTSLERLLPAPPSMALVRARVAAHFGAVFARQMRFAAMPAEPAAGLRP
ncbi:MAG: lipoyl(octanoyl) transferase LipB [Chloroflexota bacterium]